MWPALFMVYGAGESVGNFASLQTYISRQITELNSVATNSIIAATAQVDTEGPTYRLILDPSGRFPAEQIPESNTGNPDTLIDFVRWSNSIFPASSQVLILSGHGVAWQDSVMKAAAGTRAFETHSVPVKLNNRLWRMCGLQKSAAPVLKFPKPVGTRAMFPDLSGDFLSNDELVSIGERIMLSLQKKLDVIVFDACLMSSWEILSDVSKFAKVAVSFVDELSAVGLNLAGAALASARTPNDTRMLGLSFVDSFNVAGENDACIAIDMALPHWNEAQHSFEQFCDDFLVWLTGNPVNMEVGRRALKPGGLVKYAGGLADLQYLSMQLQPLALTPTTGYTKLKETVALLSACVIGRKFSTTYDHRNALGISLFAPSNASEFSNSVEDYKNFVSPISRKWLQILSALYSS